MKVLSLFDGLGGCRIALDRLGVEVEKYYSSEIDKYAMQVCSHNYPDTIHLGSVCDWQEWEIEWGEIGLVTGGFPCQAWSIAGKQLGDKDERGMLFWTMLDVMKKVLSHNPKAKFLIENVKMKKEFEEYITYHTEQALGHVEKILINSALVSAQNRNRWYWHNLGEVQQPEDKGLVLADVIENGYADREKSLAVTSRINGATKKRYLEKSMHQMVVDEGSVRDCFVDREKSYCIDANYHKGGNLTPYFEHGRRQLGFERPCGNREKSQTILSTIYKENPKSMIKRNKFGLLVERSSTPKLATKSDIENLTYRKLTPLECERLQTLSDNYTLILDENGKQLVSNTQRYKMIGNGWTIDVICHLLKSLKKD